MRSPTARLALWLGAGAFGCSGGSIRVASVFDAGDESESLSDAALDAAPEASVPAPPIELAWSAVDANIADGDIVSIWGTGADDVYIGTDVGEIYRLSSGIPSGRPVASGTVFGAGWGSDPQNVYAAGASAWLAHAGLASQGGLYQLGVDGSWDSVASGTYYSVWGSSGSDVYAAGPAGVVHSIAGAPFNVEPTAGANVLSLGGSGVGDVFAASNDASGAGAILHSTGGGNWQTVTPVSGDVWAIWSSGPGDVFAIVSAAPGSETGPSVLHSQRDGSWVTEPVGEPSTQLVTIWGSGPNDVYAGGWQQGSSGRSGVLFHSTGDGQWVAVDLPGRIYDVRSIWGSSAADVYVGTFDTECGPVLLHGQP